MLRKEFAPLIVQQRAVGLHGVQEGHPRPAVFFHQVYGAPVETQPHQRRLAALPGDVDTLGLVRPNELADILLQQARSCETCCRGRRLPFQEEAVGTVQIAGRLSA